MMPLYQPTHQPFASRFSVLWGVPRASPDIPKPLSPVSSQRWCLQILCLGTQELRHMVSETQSLLQGYGFKSFQSC